MEQPPPIPSRLNPPKPNQAWWIAVGVLLVIKAGYVPVQIQKLGWDPGYAIGRYIGAVLIPLFIAAIFVRVRRPKPTNMGKVCFYVLLAFTLMALLGGRERPPSGKPGVSGPATRHVQPTNEPGPP